MPQTGPRPVYTAPAAAACLFSSNRAAGRSRTRRDSARSADLRSPSQRRPRPAPGMGGAPGGAPGGPGARRPMHPTRSSPAGGAPGCTSRLRPAPRHGSAPRLRPASRSRRSSRPGAASGRSAASAACRRWTRAPWPPAISQVQGRPDEGLRSAIALRRSPDSC